MKIYETEAIIIGGGATGTGIARDLSLRGIKSILIEKDDIASGTTGRNHGLLHSGARYAVKDLESAKECIRENRILKKIARHCVEETGGLFITLRDDDPSYHNKLLEGCRFAGIKTEEIGIKKALVIEPNLNPEIMRAVKVPDGTIDPFRLTASNMLDAIEKGAQLFTYTKVTEIILNNSTVAGVKCISTAGEKFEIRCNILINAAGIWGQKICALAGIELKMFPSKGSMLIVDYRINSIVINRCRMPSDGDIIVPGDTVSLIGTTSKTIGYEKIEDLHAEDDEINILLKDGEKLIPALSKARALRAYAGVRPLVAISGEASGREISRGIVLIDHEERDRVKGIITIAGGKLMTYRLMAEMTSDMVCKKLKVNRKCSTHRLPLPGSEKRPPRNRGLKKFAGISQPVVKSTLYRHGIRVYNILKNDKKNYRIICECEMVTEGEIEYSINCLNVKNIADIRRRTRIGMGPCQGELCAYRVSGLLNDYGKASPEEAVNYLREFLEERWKGIKPVLWGDALRESEFTYWIYQGLLGLGEITKPEKPRKGKK